MAENRCATAIHPTALVHPRARIGRGVIVGAYADIGPEVSIGDGSEIGPGVSLAGPVEIGAENFLGPSVRLGTAGGGPVILGDRNSIREFCCVAAGRSADQPTKVGDDNLIMACCHLGAGCRIGNHLVLANGGTVGENVTIGDRVTISGLVRIEASVRIGRLAMVGGVSHLDRDVPPFTVVTGNPAAPRCINYTGLKRCGLTAWQGGAPFREFKRAWRGVFREDAAASPLGPAGGSVVWSALALEFLEFLGVTGDRTAACAPGTGAPPL